MAILLIEVGCMGALSLLCWFNVNIWSVDIPYQRAILSIDYVAMPHRCGSICKTIHQCVPTSADADMHQLPEHATPQPYKIKNTQSI